MPVLIQNGSCCCGESGLSFIVCLGRCSKSSDTQGRKAEGLVRGKNSKLCSA